MILILRSIKQRQITTITDINWFGGDCPLDDFLIAEQKLNNVIEKIENKSLSQFEAFICAYHFTSDRYYKFAPKGISFLNL